MKNTFIVFLFLLFTYTTNAQLVNIKTRIYFGTDSSVVLDKYNKRLSKFSDTAKKLTIKGILLRGNTDADADSLYNIRLSKKRVLAVRNILVKTGISDTLIHFDYYGENKPIADNESDKGKQKNRRVDVILSATIPITPITLKEEEKDTIIVEQQKDTCFGDTTFTLKEGTIITMSKCELLRQNECGKFKITEFRNPETVRDSVINTMNNSGDLLVSGGMFKIETCNNQCLDSPVILFMPIKEACEPPCTMSLWERDNRWASAEDAKVEIVKIKNKRYYKIELRCPGFFNFDCSYSMQNLTLKLPYKYRFLKIRISNDCPLWTYESDFNPDYKKINICTYCQDVTETYVYVKALNRNGDTVVMNYKKVKKLKFRYKLIRKRHCRGPKQKKPCPKNILYFFGTGKSKIKIRAKDFDVLIPSKPN